MSPPPRTEDTILAAAGELLEHAGPEGVTTRAVCAAAGVTAPTLYHHFGDKNGLLDALARHGIQDFIATKRAQRESADALEDLRQGWNRFVDFALKRPRLFRLMAERVGHNPGLARDAHAIMRTRLERLQAQGRLRLDLESAARAMQAASSGVMALHLQGTPPRDMEATAAFLFEAVTARLVASD